MPLGSSTLRLGWTLLPRTHCLLAGASSAHACWQQPAFAWQLHTLVLKDRSLTSAALVM